MVNVSVFLGNFEVLWDLLGYSKISDGLVLTRMMGGILRIAGPKFSGAIPLELVF